MIRLLHLIEATSQACASNVITLLTLILVAKQFRTTPSRKKNDMVMLIVVDQLKAIFNIQIKYDIFACREVKDRHLNEHFCRLNV